MKYFMLLAFFCCSTAFAQDSQTTIGEFRGIPTAEPFFVDAYGYAVFPRIAEGGIGLGGAYGKGEVYKQGVITGSTSVKQISLGLQLGGQVYSMIIFFENADAYNQFTDGNFEFGAQATAIALTASASASAGTKGISAEAGAKQTMRGYTDGMAVFTLAQGGLMYQAAIAGQTFSFNPN